MKLLLFSYEFPPLNGGIGRYCATLSKVLPMQGHEVVVVIPRLIEGADSAAAHAKVECLKFHNSPLRMLVDAFRLHRAIETHQPDHVLATHGFSFVPLGLLSLVSSFRYVVTLIGSDVNRAAKPNEGLSKLQRYLFRRTLVHARNLICISHYSKDLLLSAFPRLAEKARVIHIGLDREFFEAVNRQKTTCLRSDLGLQRNVVLLTVSRLVPRKGHDQVLRGLGLALASCADLHYLIVGSGPDQTRLTKLVRDLNLEANVTFAGPVPAEDLKDYYDLADIYVMPSRQEGHLVEGLGLAFLEASARGLPCIGGHHGGVSEAIVNGSTGYLVDPEAADEIARRILQLRAKPDLRREMGRRARKFVKTSFSADEMAWKTIQLLQK